MQPRIYTYKITFKEVPHYYYGVHKEKRYDEEYWGSPVTHKDYWINYTPQKEIIEFFDFSDEGWELAHNKETELIRPVYNSDPYCLNEHCGGKISLSILREVGRKNGKKTAKYLIENKLGIHGWTKEQFVEHGRKNGKKLRDLKLGIFSLTPEQRSQNSKKSDEVNRRNNTGIYALTREQKSIGGRKGGKIGGKVSGNKNKELRKGYCGLTLEERRAAGRIGGLISGAKVGPENRELKRGICGMTKEEKGAAGKKGSKNTNSQKWMCLETGFISTPGPLSHYQKSRGIDTSKRIKI